MLAQTTQFVIYNHQPKKGLLFNSAREERLPDVRISVKEVPQSRTSSDVNYCKMSHFNLGSNQEWVPFLHILS